MTEEDVALVRDMAELTSSLQNEAPPILANRELTYEDADKLHRTVDRVYDQSEGLIDLLQDQDADPDHLIDVAEQIEREVGNLHEAIGVRVIELLERRKG